MKTVCKINQCSGCMACVDVCPRKAVVVKDELMYYNAVIQEDKCINCNACHAVCQNNHSTEYAIPTKWFQGWAKDIELRKRCSSGGYATAISEGFIRTGGKVCACTFQSGRFVFKVVSEIEGVRQFSGSKYVKSNPSGYYNEVKKLLKKGERVLFIGLPCQVSAMKSFVGKTFNDKLYSIDLICHGAPSPKVLNLFLEQHRCSLEQIDNIQFRNKVHFESRVENYDEIQKGVKDNYSIAFLDSLIYTENCYHCQYARIDRVSDLTLGDSWGTMLPEKEREKGISLALCQNHKGQELLEMADIILKEVDLNNAVTSNAPLNKPPTEPKGRKKFFVNLKSVNFNRKVFLGLPKQCIRQKIKLILMKIGLLRNDHGINYSIAVLKERNSNEDNTHLA